MARNIVPWAPKLAQFSSKAKYKGPRVVPTPNRVVWMVWIGFLVILAGDIVVGEKGLLKGRALDSQLAQIIQSKAAMQKERDRLGRDLAIQKNDPRSYEKPAREKYRMVKKGESLYLFEDDNIVPAGPWDEAFEEGLQIRPKESSPEPTQP